MEPRIRFRRPAWCVALLLATSLAWAAASAQPRTVSMAFTVSMARAAEHIYRVVLRCERLPGPTQEFKLPVWSPGYYAVLDFPGRIGNFEARAGTGETLEWERSCANCWNVRTGNAASVTVSYDVHAPTAFVANPYLGEDRGLIIGTGVFMYPAGMLSRPVTVTIELNPAWKDVATSLDAAGSGGRHVFAAPDFDVLYDSPILMGNLESLPSFEVDGVPHEFIGYRLGGGFDRNTFIADLRAVVEQGIRVIGEIPYRRYVFLGIGPGRGGIEHLNSAAVPFSGGPSLETREDRLRVLDFLAHEYFHTYNVKRIRPIALGPFDYDRPNVTSMLWVSEGFSVYYQYLMVARAGLRTQGELLAVLSRTIASHENGTGRLFQSAAESSRETWTQGPFGGRGRTSISKSISYYDRGAALAFLLDLEIRHQTNNRRSLDTVMQTLYRRYYRELDRGWTDAEFRAVCEEVAGASLGELFDYASSTRTVDYRKYLAHAGLEFETAVTLLEPYFGAIVEDLDGRLVVAAVEPGSPAEQARVAAEDEIRAVDGAKHGATTLDALVKSKRPGDALALTLARGGLERGVRVYLGHAVRRSFSIAPIARPDALQSAILGDLAAPRR